MRGYQFPSWSLFTYYDYIFIIARYLQLQPRIICDLPCIEFHFAALNGSHPEDCYTWIQNDRKGWVGSLWPESPTIKQSAFVPERQKPNNSLKTFACVASLLLDAMGFDCKCPLLRPTTIELGSLSPWKEEGKGRGWFFFCICYITQWVMFKERSMCILIKVIKLIIEWTTGK